jgi:transposase
MSDVALNAIVYDETIYPRSEWSQATVNRYAEALAAGERFPPIVLESGTNRLLDGMHRARAHQAAELDTIDVEYHDIPAGVPAKLYAASLSAKHGDRVTGEDMREIAREIATANPDYSIVVIAKYLGVTRQTVGKWVGDITERRREIRRVRSLLLTRAGWSNRKAAMVLGVDESVVRADVKDDVSPHLTEDLLREAAEGMPAEVDVERIVEEIRQERIFAAWSDDERALLERLRAGETVVVSQRHHNDFIGWAESAGLYARIDRRTPWGNPFELPDDGDRDTVIANYAAHYLPFKPSLTDKLETLKGKALGCWCAPEPCHGDVLKAAAEGDAEAYEAWRGKASVDPWGPPC